MLRLTEILQQLEIPGEVDLAGRWVTLRAYNRTIYIVEAGRGGTYFTWCDDAFGRRVERYTDAAVAVAAGLHRAAELADTTNE